MSDHLVKCDHCGKLSYPGTNHTCRPEPTESNAVHHGITHVTKNASDEIVGAEERFTTCGAHLRQIDYQHSYYWDKVTCEECLKNRGDT